MDWLSQNWFWVLFGLLFIGMHLGHGGHGSAPPQNAGDPYRAPHEDGDASRRSGHQH